jgi:hypothetical protein
MLVISNIESFYHMCERVERGKRLTPFNCKCNEDMMKLNLSFELKDKIYYDKDEGSCIGMYYSFLKCDKSSDLAYLVNPCFFQEAACEKCYYANKNVFNKRYLVRYVVHTASTSL